MRTTDGNLANAAAANPFNALESAEAAMDPKQLVANVRKYWDQDDSVESHSKAVPPSSSGNKRAGRRRPSTTGATGPRRRKKEVLVKDWKYWRKNAYRGGGAIWTDPSVHCPPSRQQFVGRRPDLDARHDAYVKKQIEKEQRKHSRHLKERSDAKRKQQTRFLRQREMNHMVEMGVVNERPMTAPQVSMQYDIVNTGSGQEGPAGEGTVEDDRSMQLTPRITMEGNAIKDQKFYRRNGSMWTDYIHTAPDRLHLVLNDKIINADKRAADFIRQRYEEDRNQEEMKERMKIMRTKEMREEFQRKQRFGSKVPKATKLTPCSERINQLARPKTSRDAYKEAGPLDGIDFKGLLVVDHTVGPLVRDRVRRNSIKNEAKGEKISRRGRRKSRDMPQEQDRIRTAPASSRPTSDPLNKSSSTSSTRRGEIRPNTANNQQPRHRNAGSARPSTAPAWAPRQQPKYGGFGDVRMEGVTSSMGENSIVGAMMREAQSTLAELDQFEDRRDMLERRKKYEGPENWFRNGLKELEQIDRTRNKPNNASTAPGGRPSTAPVESTFGSSKRVKGNALRGSKKDRSVGDSNYWSFLSSKEEKRKSKPKPGKFSKERMIFNRAENLKNKRRKEMQGNGTSEKGPENPEMTYSWDDY
eukprot:g11391.t1